MPIPKDKKGLTIDMTSAARAYETYLKLTSQKRLIKKYKDRHSGLRGAKTNIVSEKDKCVLCDEVRSLEKCHIFPIWWSNCYDYETLDELPHFLQDVMMLCPTHHRLYDKNMLNVGELNQLRDCLNEYKNYLPVYLSRLAYNPEHSLAGEKALDKFLESVWNWWRLYYV